MKLDYSLGHEVILVAKHIEWDAVNENWVS